MSVEEEGGRGRREEGGEGENMDNVGYVLRYSPCQAKAIIGARSTAQFINDDQRVFCC